VPYPRQHHERLTEIDFTEPGCPGFKTTAAAGDQHDLQGIQRAPASANGDNAAFASGTSAGYIGYIDVVAGQGMATGAAGWGAAVEGAEPAAVVAAGSVTLYALVEARASYVPGNAEVITLRAEVEHS
jgi:hypothetical protein